MHGSRARLTALASIAVDVHGRFAVTHRFAHCPLKELELLRTTPPVVHRVVNSLAEGLTPLAGVNSSQVDIEITFDWAKTSAAIIPTTPNLQVPPPPGHLLPNRGGVRLRLRTVQLTV